MATLQPGSWQAVIERNAPEFYKDMMKIREGTLKEGALPLKVKILMTMLCDALLAHEEGVANIANRARAVGATEEEIAETVAVAYLMGGTPALVTGAAAFRGK